MPHFQALASPKPRSGEAMKGDTIHLHIPRYSPRPRVGQSWDAPKRNERSWHQLSTAEAARGGGFSMRRAQQHWSHWPKTGALDSDGTVRGATEKMPSKGGFNAREGLGWLQKAPVPAEGAGSARDMQTPAALGPPPSPNSCPYFCSWLHELSAQEFGALIVRGGGEERSPPAPQMQQ